MSGNSTSGKGLGVGFDVDVDGCHQGAVGEGCHPGVDDTEGATVGAGGMKV